MRIECVPHLLVWGIYLLDNIPGLLKQLTTGGNTVASYQNAGITFEVCTNRLKNLYKLGTPVIEIAQMYKHHLIQSFYWFTFN